VGIIDGLEVGSSEGIGDGISVGVSDGISDGAGENVGDCVSVVGAVDRVGNHVGTFDG